MYVCMLLSLITSTTVDSVDSSCQDFFIDVGVVYNGCIYLNTACWVFNYIRKHNWRKTNKMKQKHEFCQAREAEACDVTLKDTT